MEVQIERERGENREIGKESSSDDRSRDELLQFL
jgi:hypothetical protein